MRGAHERWGIEECAEDWGRLEAGPGKTRGEREDFTRSNER